MPKRTSTPPRSRRDGTQAQKHINMCAKPPPLPAPHTAMLKTDKTKTRKKAKRAESNRTGRKLRPLQLCCQPSQLETDSPRRGHQKPDRALRNDAQLGGAVIACWCSCNSETDRGQRPRHLLSKRPTPSNSTKKKLIEPGNAIKKSKQPTQANVLCRSVGGRRTISGNSPKIRSKAFTKTFHNSWREYIARGRNGVSSGSLALHRPTCA